MNRQSVIRLVRRYNSAVGILLALAIMAPAHAADGNPSSTQGQWHSNVNGVGQTANVSPSNNGVTIGIGIDGQNQGTSASPGSPSGVINESPRGPRGASGPPFSLPPLLPSTGGANVIVPGGPTSFETQGTGPPTGFGGLSIGGS